MRATGHDHKGHNRGTPIDVAVLAHDERALRRKLITLSNGEDVLVDLPRLVALETGDVLVLEDGKLIEIVAADENLLEIRGRTAEHLAQLVWHIGNRHLPCQIVSENGVPGRALIGHDHVIADMLKGLGAVVTPVCEPFSPLRGAYGDSGHSHGHDHAHHHGHAHSQPHSHE